MALIELDTKIEFSSKIRPICLPCTTGASWALKQRGKSVTCSDHEKTLLSSELVKAMFVAEETDRALERKDVIIKRGSKIPKQSSQTLRSGLMVVSGLDPAPPLFLTIAILPHVDDVGLIIHLKQDSDHKKRGGARSRPETTIRPDRTRLACLADTKKLETFKDIPDIKDIVTNNFLCTGGVDPQVDPQTCKGDGGGPLIVPYKQRYFQVGIISWGTMNSCKGPKRYPGPVPMLSRDFHTDVFHMMDWLKYNLKEDLEFLN
ncbi:unnamed protein product [Ranitomeya imitator]|uniref:Peptidase S1 domain-containing protein n=1 Tax=Ranitomeya imitator TaxID=111125 RepID=A0ABN9MC39_9NEOB|nr:unnamed protein product [Ranitomeya imitator]